MVQLVCLGVLYFIFDCEITDPDNRKNQYSGQLTRAKPAKAASIRALTAPSHNSFPNRRPPLSEVFLQPEGPLSKATFLSLIAHPQPRSTVKLASIDQENIKFVEIDTIRFLAGRKAADSNLTATLLYLGKRLIITISLYVANRSTNFQDLTICH